MSSPRSQGHVTLKKSALTQVRAMYPNVSADAIWRVEAVNGGYGRDALHLVAVEKLDAAPRADAERVVVWRGPVVGLSRCDRCGIEGHSMSTATAANCPVRQAEVAELNAERSRLMTERWERLRKEAAEMQAGKVSGQAVSPDRGIVEPAGADPEPAFFPEEKVPF